MVNWLHEAMTSKALSVPKLFAAYKQWISSNPTLAADFETTVKWVSYFVAGRVHNSYTLSELIYSLSNLLVLFNDRIIRFSRNPIPENGHRLKTFLTVIEYAEVFLEISARKLWGKRGRWLVVFSVQLIKCISRLVLLLVYKEKITRCPAIAPLRRRTMDEEARQNSELQIQHSGQSFTLTSSGRVIRTVAAAPPVQCRDWRAPRPPPLTEDEEEAHGKQQTLAEIIYVTKPLVHLTSLYRWGDSAWKPWFVSLAMDLSSLQMYRRSRSYLNRKQRLELSRRSLTLLLYILRSPFYEKYSARRIDTSLQKLSDSLPLVRVICQPLKRYIPEWQQIYFYMWSS